MVVVKNEDYGHRPFRSTFAVKSGVFYYEAIALTEGEMRFGWATREAESSYWKKIGDDRDSIGLELGNECRVFHRSSFSISSLSPLNSGNVIGCLIDTSNRQFQFFLNGQQVKSPDNVHFSKWPYYATVSLGQGQECQLNFGQAPFKFAPKDIRFSDLNETSENTEKYQLTETVEYLHYYWFAHPVIANRIDLFYCDPKQVKCDELVRQLEHIEHNQTTRFDHSVECGRLIQSVIEVLGRRLTCDHSDLAGKWVKEVIEKIKDKTTYFEEAKLIELLYPYLQLTITSSNSITCHNISTILIIMLFSSKNYLKRFSFKKFYKFDNFLSQSIETFQLFINAKMFITDPLKFILFLNRLESLQLPQTKQALQLHFDSFLSWCCELFGQMASVSRLYEPSFDLVRLQAAMCARWFCDHVMARELLHFPSESTLNPEDKTEHIKLSSDCLSARNDFDWWQSVRSVCSVGSNIFYYEAVLITSGQMRIGWATGQSELGLEGIGNDRYSIGFDGSYGHEIYHQFLNLYDNSLISKCPSKPRWSVGDVVGCLIDFKQKIFEFYLNGKLVSTCEENYNVEYLMHFSVEPYYVAVSLSSHQQCYLNLGQCPFRHPPSVPFLTFHKFSTTALSTPLHSPRLSECYSQVQVLAKDRVELVFDNHKQKQSDQLVNEFVENLSKNENLQINFTKVDRLRLLQSLISVSGNRLLDSCLPVHTSWIDQLITQSTSDNLEFPDLAAQLLYPFFTLHLTNDTVSKHRNVCIVLSSLITEIKDFKEQTNFRKQILTYLTEIISSCNEFLLIQPMIVLGNMTLEETERKHLSSNLKFYNSIELKRNLDLSDTCPTNLDFSLKHQIALLSQWLFEHLLNSNQTSLQSSLANCETLDPSKCSARIKLSSDLLSVRSDHNWQSVRSLNSISSKQYYYEVTLVTSGPMRFGWAAETVDLTNSILGDDKYSIGFDGHNRCIWHKGRQYSKEIDNIPQWIVGDVLGCMILTDEKRFAFYLNGKPIPMSFLEKFSLERSYYPATSLSTFQQCQFNFAPVKYPQTSRFILSNRQIDRTFDDTEQVNVDDIVKNFERVIDTSQNIDTMIQYFQANSPFRISQSLIEAIGKQANFEKQNIYVNLIVQMITECSRKVSFPQRFCQLLYPYFTLQMTDNSISKHRNVCIFLSSILNQPTIQDQLEVKIHLHRAIFEYLTKIVSISDQFEDEVLLFFALIALGNMDLNKEERQDLSSNAKFCAIIESKRNLNLDNISTFAVSSNFTLLRQLVLLSQWTFDHLLNLNQTNRHSSQTNRETLDPLNCGAHLKLSTDRLSARSDRNWQSVRSITSLSSKKYFFEVTLVTSGPMRLGWAAENVDLANSILGADKYSIAFDGHSQCIWHNGKQLPVNLPQWSVGDVVGCMVLINEKRFKFYLNQQSIKLPLLTLPPYFSSVKSYYAAVSLSTFQQCQFNFSAKTKVSPKSESFRVINAARNSIRKGCTHIINQSVQAINSVVAYNGNVNTGNITLQLTYSDDRPNDCSNENSVINSTAAGDITKSQSTSKANSHKLEDTLEEQEENDELSKIN